MAAVLFPDGVVMEAPSWTELLRRWGSLPWCSDLTAEEFREELAKRAWVWSMANVDPSLPPRHFFLALEMAGLVRILHEEGEAERIAEILRRKK